MCSILCWILSIWEALGCTSRIFGLIHALSTMGEKFEHVLAYWMHLKGYYVVLSHFWAMLCTGLTGWGHRSGRSECRLLFRCWAPVWPVLLTGQSKAESATLSCDVVCMHSSRGSCIGSGRACMCVQGELACVCRGSLHVCTGGALCGFQDLVWWFFSLLEHGFVSVVSSRCPCLRGPRLVFFKWSCSLHFLWLSIACWSFF
jgi:hypothetical protein